MGQFLANGIAIEIKVYAKENEKRELKDLDLIKKHLSKYFCLDYYEIDIEKNENSFNFNIKKDMLEDNIHDCIRDFSRLIRVDLKQIIGNDEIDYNSKEFNQDNYPLRLELEEDYNGKTLEIVGKEGRFYSGFSFYDPYWLYWDCDLFEYREKYNILLNIKTIWIDYSKISMEDETTLLYCLNKMKKEFFKNPLAQSTVFFIDG